MKNVFNVLVYAEYTTKLESIFNRFRIGMNDWDKSKVMNLNGYGVVNYTVVCTAEDYNDIIAALNN